MHRNVISTALVLCIAIGFLTYSIADGDVPRFRADATVLRTSTDWVSLHKELVVSGAGNTVSFVEAGSGGTNKAVLELLCAMGHEYLRAKQLTLAQSLFGEASALSRRYLPAALGLARTYRRQGNPAAAVREYRRALQIEPGNREAEEALGELTLDERLKAGIR